MRQVFELEQAPAQDSVLSVEPVRKGRELSERINALVADLRKGRAVYPQCFVVRQGTGPSTTWLPGLLLRRCDTALWLQAAPLRRQQSSAALLA